jgi:hypothetical protein
MGVCGEKRIRRNIVDGVEGGNPESVVGLRGFLKKLGNSPI